MTLDQIRHRVAQFAQVRNWDQFHTPKNLSMAPAAEAAELLETFRAHGRTIDGESTTKKEMACFSCR